MATRRKGRRERNLAERHEGLWGNRAKLILVPLDGSEEAKVALPVARLVARLARASIHIVHATERWVNQEELLSRVRLAREEVHGLIIDQVIGPAGEAIIDLAVEKKAMAIVMTTRGKTAYQGRTVRPVVEKVVMEAPCPLMLVRPEIDPQVVAKESLQRILVPLDGAPSTASAMGPALSLAQDSGAEAHILYVAAKASRPDESGTLTTPRYLDQPHYEWSAWYKEFVERFGSCLGRRLPPSTARAFLRRGDPAAEILRFAVEHESDLIVITWRGRMDVDHANIVRSVLEEAPCPVLLLRASCDKVGGG